MRITVCVLLLAWGLATSAWAAEPQYGTVMRIADGDSCFVDVGQRRWLEVRIRGIDAPESAWPGHWKAQPYSGQARAFAERKLKGRRVQLQLGPADRYGRRVGDLTVDGEAYSRQIVRVGLAWWNPRYAPEDDALQRLQTEARTARRGLWSEPQPVPPWVHREMGRTRGVPPEPAGVAGASSRP